jgi:peptidoglycan/xylan/chitin deacetylase (PgdA/CDA1 family)
MNNFSLILAGGIAAVTAGLGGYVRCMLHPRSQLFGEGLHCADSSTNEYALTFDDGPTLPWTERILDILAEENAPATFFVIGRNIEKHPDVLKRIHDAGHIVANHSFDHSHFGMLRGGRFWRGQVARTDALIESITGQKPAFFRPPMGAKTWPTCGAARRAGHSMVMWSRRAFDGKSGNTRRILERLVPNTCAGDILMMHDGIEPNYPRDPQPSVEAVRPLIRQLRDRGLVPGRLDQMLNRRAYASSAPAAGSSAAC